MKKITSPAGEVIAQCVKIMLDPNETPERRKRAEYWRDRLMEQTDGWEGGGITKAEAAGISVPSDAPGGQKIGPPETVAVPRNENAEGHQHYLYEGGSLSSEVSSRYRSKRWSAEKTER